MLSPLTSATPNNSIKVLAPSRKMGIPVGSRMSLRSPEHHCTRRNSCASERRRLHGQSKSHALVICSSRTRCSSVAGIAANSLSTLDSTTSADNLATGGEITRTNQREQGDPSKLVAVSWLLLGRQSSVDDETLATTMSARTSPQSA